MIILTSMFGHIYLPDVDARCVSVYNVLEDLQKLRHRFLAVLAPRGIKLRGWEIYSKSGSNSKRWLLHIKLKNWCSSRTVNDTMTSRKQAVFFFIPGERSETHWKLARETRHTGW